MPRPGKGRRLILEVLRMLLSTLLSYFQRYLASSSLLQPLALNTVQDEGLQLTFELRHVHGHVDDRVFFANVPAVAGATSTNASRYNVRARRVGTHRPPTLRALENARRRSILHGESSLIPWEPNEVDGPDVESRETLLMLAKMTNNAYAETENADWYELGEEWSGVCIY